MKKTKLRRFLPIILTLLTVIVCAIGITATANDDVHTNQITHANIVLNDDVDLVFWTDISEDNAQNKETFMTFNDGTPVMYSGTRKIGDVTYVIYRYNNIRPQDMAKAINAKLFVNGVLTSYLDYSVKDYCQYMLSNSSSESLKTMLSDLLVYGAEAQTFVNDTETPLATDGVVGLKPSETPDKFKVLYGNEVADDLARGATASISQSKLLMDNGTELLFNIDLPSDADISDYTVCMNVNGREQEVKITSSGYFNRALLTGIYAHELFDNVEINIYKDSIRVSNSMSFSLASYLDALNTDEKYTKLTNAYYNFGLSAHVYGGSHAISMPGEIQSNGLGSNKYDANGYVTYTCSLCGADIETLRVTHLRTFEETHSNGSPANTANGGTLFTMTTETGSDGNHYLSLIRDLETNKGTGGFGYYMTTDQARNSALGDGALDTYGQYTNNKFTFAFDIKAPENGIAPIAYYLQNTNTSGTGRYGKILEIGADGSITRDGAKIAAPGTINSDNWTNISVTIERYTTSGGDFLYFEYYVNGVLANSTSISNPLLNASFTRLHLSMGTEDLTTGQGILLDNLMFAQGCVHPFTEDVYTYVNKVDSGNLREVIDMVQNDFSLDDFSWVVRWNNGETKTYKEYQPFKSLDTTAHPDPESTPKSYDHPRLLFNSSDIPKIIENIEKEENANAKTKLMDLVKTNTDGKLRDTSSFSASAFEYTNYDTSILRIIEAKAMYYAIYKDDPTGQHTDARLRGYQAIYAMKNYMLTFDVQWKASDQCRYYGEMMYYAALVYDWCYDLLTDEDKLQIMTGVQNLACDGTNNQPWLPSNTHEGRKLEGGFPALAVENQSALTGHGAEAQVLRDYFSFAVAIFDEDPTWYDYVGGMIYDRYVDARNYFYSSGFYPDGSAVYNSYRYLCDLYNAWIFKSMGVEFPYNGEDMATVVHGLMSMETYELFQFATADGSGTSWAGQSRISDTIGDCALISSHLFDDDVALAIAKRLCDYRYQGTFYSHQLGTSAANYLILTSNGLTPAEDWSSKIDNVEYHDGFQQQVVSRDGREEDSVVVLMQGAQHYPGGHTHQNAGNFQIWYKGMLTRDDGLYDAYGSDHHFYYHMSGSAHNTLLIYNPGLANVPLGPANKIGYYNGAQKYELGIPVSYEPWIENNKFSYGKPIGMQTDDAENPSYVYFANDITNAYDQSTVDYVERSFMTLYTGDEETPMVMFIFDNITSDKADFQKTFLLQCATEPNIDGNVVTVDNGEGKLVLTSLLGADDIKAYGRTSVNGQVGEGIKGDGSERFYLSGAGTSLNPGGADMISDKNTDLNIVWGHVEVRPDAVQATNQLVNVLYVSDSGTVVSETPTLVTGNYVNGATFKNSTSVFVNDAMHASDELYFTTTGEGTMKYYVGGLGEGTWKVTIGGELIGEYTSTEEGRMITFEGATGDVVITPSSTMRPPNTGAIYYNFNGGKFPTGVEAPSYYYYDQETAIPIPTKTDSSFEGWFTDKECKNPLVNNIIPADSRDKVVLYAKWSSPIVYVDYTKGGSLGDFAQVAHSLEASQGSFKIVNSDDGNYLLWNVPAGKTGSIIGKDGPYSVYADESLEVSFTLTLGRNGSDPLLPISLYLRDAKYESGSPYRFMNIFKTDGNGNAYIGSVKFDEIANTGFTSIHFVLDFGKGMIYTYNENAELTKEIGMSSIGINYPTEYGSYENWFRNLNASGNSLMSVKGNGSGTIRVAGLSVISGNLSKSCANFGITSTAHDWDDGVVVRESSDDNCAPGAMQYTCKKCKLVKEVPIISEAPHASMTAEIISGKLVYSCGACGCTYAPEANYYLNGSSHDGIIGLGNASNFNTAEGTHLPVINGNGEYELINKTGNDGNIELWIPSKGALISGFSSANNAIGFLSFKVNALTNKNFSFNFVDTSSSGAKWSKEWCLTDSFFNISAPEFEDGQTTAKVTGWDGMELKTVNLASEQSFTGWIDVKIYIELDAENDEITLHYYINGANVGSVTKELTTSTNAINSVCITGSTGLLSSGIKLDDIAFGFTPNGTWESKQ